MQPGFQKQAWIDGVGDDWLERNRATLGDRDVASETIEALNLRPKSVLEIGCSNGWRLKKMKEKYDCAVKGIEPSKLARKEAQAEGIDVYAGTADNLGGFSAGQFDMVIYGYCLCFISPEDWLKMVLESDRVLANGGHIVIYDFICTAFVKRRMMNITIDPALEAQPIYLYNYDWPKLWSGHPAFTIRTNMFNLAQAEVCTIIKKDYRELLADFAETEDRAS